MKTTSLDNGHGRLEKQEYFPSDKKINWLVQKPDWEALNSIGMVKSTVTEKNVNRKETRYFITSLIDVITSAAKYRKKIAAIKFQNTRKGATTQAG